MTEAGFVADWSNDDIGNGSSSESGSTDWPERVAEAGFVAD